MTLKLYTELDEYIQMLTHCQELFINTSPNTFINMEPQQYNILANFINIKTIKCYITKIKKTQHNNSELLQLVSLKQFYTIHMTTHLVATSNLKSLTIE